MTAPDKIWADTEGQWSAHDVSEIRRDPCTEYTRTSIAQAAIAAAYEAAAQVARLNRPAPAGGPFSHTNTARVVALDIEAGIRALATPDQIAALAADRAATVTVNPLVWDKMPWTEAEYRASCAFGRYTVRAERGGMFYAMIPNNDILRISNGTNMGKTCLFDSAEAAKAAAKADYDARIRSVITLTSGASPDTIPLPRAEVEALMEAARAAWDEACANHEKAPPIKYLAPYGGLVRLHTALATLQERMK